MSELVSSQFNTIQMTLTFTLSHPSDNYLVSLFVICSGRKVSCAGQWLSLRVSSAMFIILGNRFKGIGL